MRTSRKPCASSNQVRTFQGRALDPVPLTRKVVLPLFAASIACLETKTRVLPRLSAFIHTFLIRFAGWEGEASAEPLERALC
jgi:hypothetical protein